ncbi:YggT family protein [Sphingomonas sp.]|uniref:YggT family protein n=1 Tax=Sphingomonas sp. TaxID=28214 RepID=UPI00286AAF32|nr:YggT family protein [Sphingomonas sp.]
MNTVAALFAIPIILLNILWWVIIVQAILSWLLAFNVLNTGSPAVRQIANALDRVTAPLYRPIRRLLPDFGGIDFSPMVVLILIMIVQKLLAGVAMDVTTAGIA